MTTPGDLAAVRAGQVHALDWQHTRHRIGGQDKRVVGDGVPNRGRNGSGGAVDRGDALAGANPRPRHGCLVGEGLRPGLSLTASYSSSRLREVGSRPR